MLVDNNLRDKYVESTSKLLRHVGAIPTGSMVPASYLVFDPAKLLVASRLIIPPNYATPGNVVIKSQAARRNNCAERLGSGLRIKLFRHKQSDSKVVCQRCQVRTNSIWIKDMVKLCQTCAEVFNGKPLTVKDSRKYDYEET